MPGQNDEKKRVARRQIKRVSANMAAEANVEQTAPEYVDKIEEKSEEIIEETTEETTEGTVEELVTTVESNEESVIAPTEESAETSDSLASFEDINEAAPDSLIEVPQKMENPEAKSISVIRIGVVLLLVAAIVTLALSLVNFLTEGKIADNKVNAMNAAIKEIFPDSTGSQEIDYVYSEPVVGVYKVVKDDSHIGYAVKVVPSGFAGDIEMLVGINHRSEVEGVRILALSETPNVGSKVVDNGYLAEYEGKIGTLILGADVDAISGATVSSRAVLAGVNAVLALELKVDGIVVEEDESDVTIDLGKDFPVDSSLETSVIPSDSVPPVSYETAYREETSGPATETNETSIIEIYTDPADTTADPDDTIAVADDTTEAANESETVQAEETTAPDETSAAA